MTEEVEATDESRLTPMNVRSDDGAVRGVCWGRAAGSRWDNVVSMPVMSVIKCHRFGGNNTTERLIFIDGEELLNIYWAVTRLSLRRRCMLAEF